MLHTSGDKAGHVRWPGMCKGMLAGCNRGVCILLASITRCATRMVFVSQAAGGVYLWRAARSILLDLHPDMFVQGLRWNEVVHARNGDGIRFGFSEYYT